MKIVVLAGGLSTERDVSLSSGCQIYKALKSNGHSVILLDIFMGFEGDAATAFESGRDWAAEIAPVKETAPDIEKLKASRKGCSKALFGPNVLELCGIDSKRYTGYAFGLGVERITNLKYQVSDLRMFSENDKRFLEEFEAAN